MYRFIGLVSSFILLSSASTAAEDQLIRASVTAEQLEEMMAIADLSPTMMTDTSTGMPIAAGKMDGTKFIVRALDCSGTPVRCGQLLMFANFSLGRDVDTEDFRIVNDFNETKVNGRAYVTEDKSLVGVDFIIDMTGGVTSKHVDSRMARWPNVIREFKQKMVEESPNP